MIAKSWKSSCACSMNRCRSAPATGGSGRSLHRRGALAEAREHRVDVELIVGHRARRYPTQRATSTRGAAGEVGADDHARRTRRSARAPTSASAWCGASSQHEHAPRRQPLAAPARARARSPRVPVGPDDRARARLVVGDLRRQRRRPRARRRTAGSTRSARSAPRSSAGQRVEPRARRAMRTRVAAQPGDVRARATSSASALTSVAHTSTSGSSASSASAIAPDPVPRSATAPTASASTSRGAGVARRSPSALGLLERDLDDLLGLGSRDQHARGRPSGRARGTPTRRARTAAARRATRRSTMREQRAARRAVGGVDRRCSSHSAAS